VSVLYVHRDGTPASTSVRHYPGGEFLIDVEDPQRGDAFAFVRTATPDDLVELAVWANTVDRLGGWPIGLVPYLPGARADHAEYDAGYDAAAYARLLRAAGLAELVCVDPHSPVMPSLVDRCLVVAAADVAADVFGHLPDLAGVIAPDKGATDRAAEVAMRLRLPVYQALKHRDFDSGKLSGFTCERLPEEGSFLVVDDICDGGGTFRGLAEAIGVGRDRLHLWVTHGIFSGTAARLANYYSTVTTTDSHEGHHNLPKARVIELLPYMLARIQGAP